MEHDDIFAIKKNSAMKAKTMSVRDMGKLLGLKKTDSYWLVHNKNIKTVLVNGFIRVDIEHFEEWYSMQTKYRKIDGSPPGLKLAEFTYSTKDIENMLNVSKDTVYVITKTNNISYILVDYVKRWSKVEFDEWYFNQKKYWKPEEYEKNREIVENSISFSEMAFILGIHRNSPYSILKNNINKHLLETVIVGEQKRITKKSFCEWYKAQNRYVMKFDTIEEGQAAKKSKDNTVSKSTQVEVPTVPDVSADRAEKKNNNCYSINEATKLLGISNALIRKMIRNKRIKAISIGGQYRIPVLEVDRFILKNNESEGE